MQVKLHIPKKRDKPIFYELEFRPMVGELIKVELKEQTFHVQVVQIIHEDRTKILRLVCALCEGTENELYPTL